MDNHKVTSCFPPLQLTCGSKITPSQTPPSLTLAEVKTRNPILNIYFFLFLSLKILFNYLCFACFVSLKTDTQIVFPISTNQLTPYKVPDNQNITGYKLSPPIFVICRDYLVWLCANFIMSCGDFIMSNITGYKLIHHFLVHAKTDCHIWLLLRLSAIICFLPKLLFI